MPYIRQPLRDTFDLEIDGICKIIGNYSDVSNVEGVLNYVITSILANKTSWYQVLDDDGFRYKHYNSMIGVLECAKQEIYRRMVSKYEDQCIAKHGDIEAFE